MSYIYPDLIVDSNIIKKWSNSYLDEYMNVIENKFGHEYGYYFNFYEKHPFKIKSVISNKNGVAIDFFPDSNIDKNLYESTFTDKELEVALFKDNILKNPIEEIINPEDFTDEGKGIVMFVLDNSTNWTIKDLFVQTNQGDFIEFKNNSDLLLIDIAVDNVVYHYCYLDGCNKNKCWTEENAKKTTQTHLKNGLMYTFDSIFDNETFKEYFASQELENKITSIKDSINKKKKDQSYTYDSFQFANDLKELDKIAYETYNVSNDFLTKTWQYVNSTYTFRYENNFSSVIIWSIVLLAVSIFVQIDNEKDILQKIENLPKWMKSGFGNDLIKKIKYVSPFSIYLVYLGVAFSQDFGWVEKAIPFLVIIGYVSFNVLNDIKKRKN